MIPRLALERVAVRYGDLAAVRGVDLAVAPREILAVVGPSGSGKTTLLRAITGLQAISGGRICLDGSDVAPVAVHRRGVGLMFQDQALFPHRDVTGNVAFGLRMQGRSRPDITRIVGELLELVGLPGAGHRAVSELSGGEQQRVALARALAPSPRVLLLDEPMGALDHALRQRLVADLRVLFAKIGMTVVAVTHDQNEAFALADRVAVMDEGQVLQCGSPGELWARPASARVATLLGLGNVVHLEAAEGRARSPWGPVALPGVRDGLVAVMVRPSGIVLDASGPAVATVRASSFRGERSVLELDLTEGPGLRAEVPSSEAPRPGAVVRFRVDPEAVVQIG